MDRGANPTFAPPARPRPGASVPGVVESMERRMALLKLYPGAIYSHGATAYSGSGWTTALGRLPLTHE